MIEPGMERGGVYEIDGSELPYSPEPLECTCVDDRGFASRQENVTRNGDAYSLLEG